MHHVKDGEVRRVCSLCDGRAEPHQHGRQVVGVRGPLLSELLKEVCHVCVSPHIVLLLNILDLIFPPLLLPHLPPALTFFMRKILGQFGEYMSEILCSPSLAKAPKV